MIYKKKSHYKLYEFVIEMTNLLFIQRMGKIYLDLKASLNLSSG